MRSQLMTGTVVPGATYAFGRGLRNLVLVGIGDPTSEDLIGLNLGRKDALLLGRATLLPKRHAILAAGGDVTVDLNGALAAVMGRRESFEAVRHAFFCGGEIV